MPKASTLPAKTGPAWEVARLYPDQGHWDEGDYLAVNRTTNHLIELTDGSVEVLEMPTRSHQRTVLYLYNQLARFAGSSNWGETLVAPYPVRLWEGKFREPDVLFMLAAHAERLGEDFAEGADLVMEVVSDDRQRDLETKRKEYARAKVAEYWIIDPREQRVTILKLAGRRYAAHGAYGLGDRAASAILPGFQIDVKALFSWTHRKSG